MILNTHPAAGWIARKAERSDRPAIEALFLACIRDFPWRGPPGTELTRLRRTLLSADIVVAEELQAGIVGFISYEAWNAYVPHLFVEFDWRLCGVGRGLLAIARDAAGRRLRLDVDLQNRRARAAYAALGWTEQARSGWGPKDQVRMVSPD